MKPKAVVSLCWYGVPCRYHGRPVPSPSKIARLEQRFDLVPICPERLGGLPTPRPGAPLRLKRGKRITDTTGRDVSAAFLAGAAAALRICQERGIQHAYLCKGSPSCDKRGFTGELLTEYGIRVVNL